MVQTRALNPKEGQLVPLQGWSCFGRPKASLAPSAGVERARRELELQAQCESHWKSEKGKDQGQLLPLAALLGERSWSS